MLEIEVFHCGPYPENCYLVWDSESKDALIIDPGMTNDEECREIEGFIARHGLKLTHMVNTHLHFDHIWGVNFIKSTYGLPLEANNKDTELGMNAVRQALVFGQNPVGLQNVTIEKPLKQGDVIKVGNITFNVIETPGQHMEALHCTMPRMLSHLLATTSFGEKLARPTSPVEMYKKCVSPLFTRYLHCQTTLLCIPDMGHKSLFIKKSNDIISHKILCLFSVK